MKRQLPQCGVYKLESHLPVFLWKKQIESEGHVFFWNLLELLAKHQPMLCSETNDEDQHPTKSTIENCIFCGKQCKGIVGCKLHERKCPEKC